MSTKQDLVQLLEGRQLLIFDFDGTVADTSPLHAAAFKETLAPLGVSVDYPSIAGRRTLDAMRYCLAESGMKVDATALDALVMEKQRRVRKLIGEGLAPLRGVDEFLRWARPRYQLSMVTSGSRATVTLALARLGYNTWFEPLICADDLRRAKPDPEGFLKLLEVTGIHPEGALVFEDSAAGFSAARQAGLEFVDVNGEIWHSYLSQIGI